MNQSLPKGLLASATNLGADDIAFLARRAERVYRGKLEIKDAIKRAGGRLVRFWDVGTVEAFLAIYDEKVAVLSFRGTEPTEEPADLLEDLKFRRIGSNSGKGTVHRGFAEAMKRVTPDIASACSALPPGVAFYITGHSKGAANALIFDANASLKIRPSAVVTFGCPRVGDEVFAEARAKDGTPHIRVVNGCDGITAVPFLALGFLHYQHSLVYIDRKGGVRRNPSTAERVLDQVLDIVPGALSFEWKSWLPGKSLRRHDIGDYIGRLEMVS